MFPSFPSSCSSSSVSVLLVISISLLLLLLLLLLPDVISVDASSAGDYRGKKRYVAPGITEGYEELNGQITNMPDPQEDEYDRLSMSCSGCLLTSRLCEGAIEHLFSKFADRKLVTVTHGIEAIMDICQNHKESIGLSTDRRNGELVTRNYIHEKEAEPAKDDLLEERVAKGNRITSFWVPICEEAIERAEEHMKVILRGFNNTKEQGKITLCPQCKVYSETVDRLKKEAMRLQQEEDEAATAARKSDDEDDELGDEKKQNSNKKKQKKKKSKKSDSSTDL